ncbi:MAG: ABC transporter permease [Chloroflexi bacterium]|nr:ABC transporter permease [Chloroflexota bacterium]
MTAYIIRRVLGMIPTLILISMITFYIVQLPEGNFFTILAGSEASGTGQDTAQAKLQAEKYGLTEEPYIQYWKWVKGFPRGDFGYSFGEQGDVLPIVWDRMLYTMLLGGLSLVFMVVIAVPLGIYAARRQYGIGDHIFSFLGFLGLSMPSFLLALLWMALGITVLDIDVGGIYSSEFQGEPWDAAKISDYIQHLVPPAIILALASTAQIQRIMRGNLLDELGQPYVTTARAKGLREDRVVNKYAVRVAINPLISVMALEVPKVVSQSTIVGIVMTLPTTGPLLFSALRDQDIFLAGTILLFMSALLLISNLIADILLAWADPRIVYS